jgi:hypothetical protein
MESTNTQIKPIQRRSNYFLLFYDYIRFPIAKGIVCPLAVFGLHREFLHLVKSNGIIASAPAFFQAVREERPVDTGFHPAVTAEGQVGGGKGAASKSRSGRMGLLHLGQNSFKSVPGAIILGPQNFFSISFAVRQIRKPDVIDVLAEYSLLGHRAGPTNRADRSPSPALWGSAGIF